MLMHQKCKVHRLLNSTFPVLFCHGHGGVIGPPIRKDDSVNLDDDSIFNPVMQRCMQVYLVLSEKKFRNQYESELPVVKTHLRSASTFMKLTQKEIKIWETVGSYRNGEVVI